MSKTALFFPGQASQYVGMGRELYDNSAEVRRMYELVSDLLETDIAKLSFEGPAEELKRTKYTQPAIMLHSLSALTVLGDDRPKFDFAAGHSLGEYAALAVTGALSFDTALKAVVRRATLMEEACVQNPGTMAAVMGLSEEQIESVCREASADGVVVPANFNSANQIVISGSLAGVEKACVLAKQAGAKRAMLLEVGGAFHSPLMSPARDGLREFLRDTPIAAPVVPVVANVTGSPVRNGEEIRLLLVDQITAPVRWAQTMKTLNDSGVTKVVEIGPGKVLTGMAKREMPQCEMSNLDTLADIRALTVVGA
ncbi:[acyl-carrier-protein] S-malonyltransferase [candidate division GN15 bacterium]|uniref:Malonyl CoA-acyl carrier protein transacylase n=1 Tax=candidate division GN15 bacterium TaxID=2072418 RepID=A0A855X1C2_9BACT|nr:MAG: [acyl-carrier-protein] S-malonyltransferase [candidate division GN15 bacterium]